MTRNELRAIIGGNIRRRRKELGLTQQAVADAVGLSQAQINRIENASSSCPSDFFAELGEILQVDPLFFLSPQRSEKTETYA